MHIIFWVGYNAMQIMTTEEENLNFNVSPSLIRIKIRHPTRRDLHLTQKYSRAISVRIKFIYRLLSFNTGCIIFAVCGAVMSIYTLLKEAIQIFYIAN